MRTVLLVVVALVVSVTAGACAGDTTPTGPSVGPVTFRGEVTTFSPVAPRSGALVLFSAVAGIGRATTEANGTYEMTVPAAGPYTVTVDGVIEGDGEVSGAAYRGDLLVDTGTCTSRYGTVTDARTARPIGGATVTLTSVVVMSDSNGWYRIDLGCDPPLSFSTTFITASHAGYAVRQRVVGRGVGGVLRLDLVLEPN